MFRLRLLIPPAIALVALTAVGALGFWLTSDMALQAAGDNTQATTHMKEHFDKVGVMKDAVIRGDLEAMREPAKYMAEHKADGMPPKAASQILAMQTAAKRAAEASDINMAANAVATMASTCGTCHRATDVVVKAAPPAEPPEGDDLAAHMLAHQQAIEYLYQGLIVPSDDLWKKGAQLLRAAPMQNEKFPADVKLTEDIKAFEVKAHQFAGMADQARDPKTRVGVYGTLIASCAGCHGLHGRVWGPGLPK